MNLLFLFNEVRVWRSGSGGTRGGPLPLGGLGGFNLSSASLQKTATLAKLIFKTIDEVRCGIMALCVNLRWDAFKETPPTVEQSGVKGQDLKGSIFIPTWLGSGVASSRDTLGFVGVSCST